MVLFLKEAETGERGRKRAKGEEGGKGRERKEKVGEKEAGRRENEKERERDGFHFGIWPKKRGAADPLAESRCGIRAESFSQTS